MDNYFIDRDLTPRDEKGEYDFESLHALNLSLLNEHLLRLLAGERVQIPKFNFQDGKSATHHWAQLAVNQIIIMEGIHGLNPDLLSRVPADNIYRIYVSVLSQLNMDSHNRIPTTDVRLLRRIVRDARTRGYSATDTLMRWQSVRRGEKRNIFPYQENADTMFNSALAYELAALRPFAEPLLLQVVPNTPPHIEANRLLSFLRWVEPLSLNQNGMIPDTSLLRESVCGWLDAEARNKLMTAGVRQRADFQHRGSDCDSRSGRQVCFAEIHVDVELIARETPTILVLCDETGNTCVDDVDLHLGVWTTVRRF
jgi:uridine kinase